MTKMQKLFERAIDKVVKYGWIQGGYGGKTTGYCMGGAIYASSTNNVLIDNALALLYSIVGSRGIADFNDDPKRTKKQVIAVLKQASKVAA
jgi:hypothetical protein